MRFLVSRLSALGDVVCSLPAAVALKAGFPDCHITWIVDPRFADIVRACASVDEVVCASIRSLKTVPRFAEPFDAALDLQGLLKSALPVALCSSHKKLGYHWQREGSWLFSRKVLPDPTSLHVVDQYVDVARAAGGVADEAEFGLKPLPDHAASVDAMVSEDIGNSRFVVLNPGGAWATKRWPATSFAMLIDMLAAAGFETILIGSESERAIGERISHHCGSLPRLWHGRTSIGQLIALISRCHAHIGGDTGSTHIAAALGRPAVGIYSITNPIRSCPYGQIHRCLYDKDSLLNITPDQVFAKVPD